MTSRDFLALVEAMQALLARAGVRGLAALAQQQRDGAVGQLAAAVVRGERLPYAEVGWSAAIWPGVCDVHVEASSLQLFRFPSVSMHPSHNAAPSHPSPQGFVVPVCCACGKADTGSLLRCGNCRTAGYCSKECQRRAWGQHKKVSAASRVRDGGGG